MALCQDLCKQSYTRREYKRNGCSLIQVPTDIPPEASSVNLYWNAITEIRNNDFVDLIHCKQLILTSNALVELHTHMFQGLVSLETLKLDSNKIQTIAPGAFVSLTNLKTLLLGSNPFVEIRGDMWEGLDSLQELNLGFTKIQSLRPGDLDNLRNLKILFLAYAIGSLMPGSFADLSNCTELYLGGNRLKSVVPEMWTGLDSIEILFLDNNQLTDFPENTFTELKTLRELVLERNSFPEITSDLWQDLDELSSLSLTLNKIPEIRAEQWEGLTSLTRLSLSQCSIQRIEVGGFRSLPNLVSLVLSNNDLTEIMGDMWQGLENLERLSLAENKLTALRPGDLYNLPSLNFLNLDSSASLTSFQCELFDPELYPDSNGHPSELTISLTQVELDCDEFMCWMLEAQEEGWLDLWGIFFSFCPGINCSDSHMEESRREVTPSQTNAGEHRQPQFTDPCKTRNKTFMLSGAKSTHLGIEVSHLILPCCFVLFLYK